MTLFSYEIFDAVARQGSFNKAAQQLHLTPSAISHAIAVMEEELGFALFNRGKNGVSMTSYGASLYPSIRDVLNSDEALKQSIARLNGLEKGKVKLGVFNSVCASLLPGLLKSFAAHYPQIEIEVYQGTYDDVKEWLRTGQVDIAFLSSTCREEFNLTELFREPLLCIVPQDWPEPQDGVMTPALMNGQSFVVQCDATDAEIEDATPASVVSHTRRRADKADIVGMFYNVKPEVILGGGSAYFLPKETAGSKRKDSINYIQKFGDAGYKLVTDRTEMLSAVSGQTPERLLGLFHTGNMDGWVDRHQWKGNTVKKFPNQPDLTESFDAAVKVLEKNKDGFFLMLEAGLVDKYSHPLDWTRSVGDTIAFDKVVERAKAYCAKNPDTLLIVTGDHTHSISVAGTVDDNKPGKDMREKVGVYADAGYPNYEDKDKDGFPDNFQPSKRLAVFFGAHPDYYETYRSYPDATFNPAVKNEKGEYVADARYKDVEGGHFVEGNLPRNESQGVHTVDDLVVTAQGPNAEQIRGFMNSTEVFRVMAEALALGK